MSTSRSLLASITSVAALWNGDQLIAADDALASVSSHSNVFEVPVALRNVYPAENFNRDVTTAWWETGVLDGHASDISTQMSGVLEAASYIVLDEEMYQASEYEQKTTSGI